MKNRRTKKRSLQIFQIENHFQTTAQLSRILIPCRTSFIVRRCKMARLSHSLRSKDNRWDFLNNVDVNAFALVATAIDARFAGRFARRNTLVPRLGKITTGTSNLPLCWLLCTHDNSPQCGDYFFAALIFAQRAFCAAAIRARPAALILRRFCLGAAAFAGAGSPSRPFSLLVRRSI